MKFIVWLVVSAIIGAIYFGVAYGLGALVDNDGFETAAYVVAGAVTLLQSLIIGGVLAGTDV